MSYLAPLEASDQKTWRRLQEVPAAYVATPSTSMVGCPLAVWLEKHNAAAGAKMIRGASKRNQKP